MTRVLPGRIHAVCCSATTKHNSATQQACLSSVRESIQRLVDNKSICGRAISERSTLRHHSPHDERLNIQGERRATCTPCGARIWKHRFSIYSPNLRHEFPLQYLICADNTDQEFHVYARSLLPVGFRDVIFQFCDC